MQKFVSSQHETEEKYMELEEKQLKVMQELFVLHTILQIPPSY